MTTEIFDAVFVLERGLASIILLISAAYAWRLIRFHKGGTMQKPWMFLLGGILVFAAAQLVSASSAVLESYPIRLVGGGLQLIGSVVIFVGLVRLVNAWRKFEF